MRHVVALLLVLAPVAAFALDSDEFLLFGLDSAGHIIDIRPYGGEGNADEAAGDMDAPGGIHGNFYRLVGGEAKGSLKLAGICRLVGKGSWTLSCENGPLLLSGVTYAGEPITDATASLPPVPQRLYRTFLKHYEPGSPPAAVFHCTAQCSGKVPQDLILMWRGD